MSTFVNRDIFITVGVIVAITVGLSYATPFSGNIRVTIALVGLTIAYVVADRMKLSHYRTTLREDLDEGPEHAPGVGDRSA